MKERRIENNNNFKTKFYFFISSSILLIIVFLLNFFIYNKENTNLINTSNENLNSLSNIILMLINNDDKSKDNEILTQISKDNKIESIYIVDFINNDFIITNSNYGFINKSEISKSKFSTAFKTKQNIYFENNNNLLLVSPKLNKNGKLFLIVMKKNIKELKSNLIENSFISFFIYFLIFLIFIINLYIKKIIYIKNNTHTFDILTGLPNRIEFQNRSAFSFELFKIKNKDFSILFINIDGFKDINEKFCHEAGDILLIKISNRILNIIRKKDIPSRHCCDEFIISLPNTNKKAAETTAKKLLLELSKPYRINTDVINITLSIGISTYLLDGKDLKSLYKKAEENMLISKKIRKNSYFSDNILD